MKIAITGSNGFIGSYLVKYFSKQGFEVIALNRKNWDLKENFSACQQRVLTLGNNFDIFIHCASDTGYDKNKKQMIKNNVDINKNILNVVNNSNCKHFIYISSSSVYQGISGEISSQVRINKNNLQNSYSLTKYLAEEYIKENLNKNIKLAILRPRAVYGDGDRVLVPSILKNKIFGKLILPGDGKPKTSITKIDDFVDFIGEIVKLKKIGIYNFSSEVKSYNELYSQIVKEHNLSGIIHLSLGIFKFLCLFNKNKYSYIVDTFGNDKILVK